MIYLDSCAIVKLIRAEDGSTALQDWLDDRASAVMVTSELAVAEVLRVVRRSNHTDLGVLVDSQQLSAELDEARAVLDGFALVAVDRVVLDAAGALSPPMMRTLDAIHLVSAPLWPGRSVEFVTYDRRLASAAREVGLSVVSPS